jgi:hypothetical protein
MNSRLPLSSSVIAVGYQPVGIRPRTASPPRGLASTTAIAFWAAFATNRVCPSGLTVTALGEPPSSASPDPSPPTHNVPITASVSVLITETVSLFALVTYTRSPAGLNVMPVGWSPTSIVFSTVRLVVSITETVPLTGMPVRWSTTTGKLPSVKSAAPGTLPPQLLT